jgi:adenosylcobyric acid synthase
VKFREQRENSHRGHASAHLEVHDDAVEKDMHRRGALMLCGTSSDAGKSTVVAGLCRLLAREGVSVAPFKGQNMSLNSVVTNQGAEIGRAQWLQAVASGAEPEAAMNPVLLKPTGERSSQVIVMGRPLATREAADYQRSKVDLLGIVDGALADLRSRFDVVICEGAGSPAEINLLDHDIVNLGLAARAGVPAVVIGDIHRGGVFAHLYGTVALLPEDLRRCVKAFIINMFRGDPALLGNAMEQLEERCGVPTLGVLPYLPGLVLDAEDSLHRMLAVQVEEPRAASAEVLDVVVLRLPRLSNFTDVDPLLVEGNVAVRFVDHPSAFGDPDLIVLPGTKSTMADLAWLGTSGLREVVVARHCAPSPPTILGVCGGFQMLGQVIEDPDGVESAVPSVPGLGWLPLVTRFEFEKITRMRVGTAASGAPVRGYEIRHGRSRPLRDWREWLILDEGAPVVGDEQVVSAGDQSSRVYGTTLHGLFEEDRFRGEFLADVARSRGKTWCASGRSFAAARELQIDQVADACAEYLDTDALWRILEASSVR